MLVICVVCVCVCVCAHAHNTYNYMYKIVHTMTHGNFYEGCKFFGYGMISLLVKLPPDINTHCILSTLQVNLVHLFQFVIVKIYIGPLKITVLYGSLYYSHMKHTHNTYACTHILYNTEAHTHTCTHTCMHAYAHTHTRTHAHTHTQPCCNYFSREQTTLKH